MTVHPSPPAAISIVMRSMNDGPLIGKTLQGVYDQDYGGKVELIHIDSGSADETVPIIKATNPHKLIQILPKEYIPGVVLNRGMREASSEWVVFLNSDAEPANRQWLSGLLAAAQAEPRTGTAFSRQLPRPDCQAVFAHDYDRCFGPHRESARWDHFFSMVSCVVNRAAWSEHAFREDLQYAEDDEWSRRLRAHGWKVKFAPESAAIHSHNYTLRQAYKRSYGDSFAMAASREGGPPGMADWLKEVTLSTARDVARDVAWCLRHGRLRELPHAAGVRLWQRMGKSRGLREGWDRYHGHAAGTGSVSGGRRASA